MQLTNRETAFYSMIRKRWNGLETLFDAQLIVSFACCQTKNQNFQLFTSNSNGMCEISSL